jgi:hypothetical protein
VDFGEVVSESVDWIKPHEIRGSHSSDYEGYCLLGYDAV